MSTELQLPSPSAFRYLSRSGCYTADGINDVEDFNDVKYNHIYFSSSLYNCSTAFKQLNFSAEDVNWVYATCAGILHLSNIDFKADGEGSKIDAATTNALQNAARFLKVLGIIHIS